MADLFKSLKPSPNLNRNGFDLSRKSVFSTKAGLITPILALETPPDSHFSIRPSDFVRTFPLKTDSFLRAKQEIVYYWLPLSSIWREFNSWYSQRGTETTSYHHGHLYHPRFDLGAVLELICVYLQNEQMEENAMAHGALRMLDMLGYGNYYEVCSAAIQGNVETVLTNYYGRYLNPFRICAYNRYWYDFVRNKNFDLDVEPLMFNLDAYECTTLQSSIVESDIILQMLQPRYINWKRDMFMSLYADQQFGDVSIVPDNGTTSTDERRWNRTVELYSLVKTGSASTYPRTIVGSRDGGDDISTFHDHTFNADFDVMALRRAEAVQRWRENMLRSGQGNKNQFEGRFGQKLKYELDGSPIILGSTDGSLLISGVTQTSQGSSQNPLGDIAGQSSSTIQPKEITCDTAGDFGICMGLLYIRPEAEYNSTMIDKANVCLEREDYLNPELENLGLEAVHSYQLDVYGNSSSAQAYGASLNKVIGYSARYLHLKTAVDKVYGTFVSRFQKSASTVAPVPGVNSDWVVPRSDLVYAPNSSDAGRISIDAFYVNPSLFDSVFYQSATDEIETDQFLINLYQSIGAIEPISVVGMSY